MPKREISAPKTSPPGEKIRLTDQEKEFTLFLPKEWKATDASEVTLTVQFHCVVWFTIDEHLRRGLKGPLLIANLGEGSSKYRVPFEDRERFGRILKRVEQKLKERGAPEYARITTVDMASFSAGYGAVREILKSPEYLILIRRLVLCDSIYAAYEATAAGQKTRRPSPQQIEPWLEFARNAVRGEKTFVLTHSSVVPGDYASSGECAAAIIEKVGAPVVRVRPPPTRNADDYPLVYRSDRGNFHVWGYAGQDGGAHLTHVRHLADVWMALDAAGEL